MQGAHKIRPAALFVGLFSFVLPQKERSVGITHAGECGGRRGLSRAPGPHTLPFRVSEMRLFVIGKTKIKKKTNKQKHAGGRSRLRFAPPVCCLAAPFPPPLPKQKQTTTMDVPKAQKERRLLVRHLDNMRFTIPFAEKHFSLLCTHTPPSRTS